MPTELNTNGFTIVPDVLTPATIAALREAMTRAGKTDGARSRADLYGIRNILSTVPEIGELCRSPEIKALLTDAGGKGAEYFPVRGLYFDKPFRANWSVYPHQDLTIAVREKREVPGYGPWTRKAGIPHVQPPRELLQDMVTLRFHLDDCLQANGALRVLPGSHLKGPLKTDQLKGLVAREREREVICEVASGGVLIMRPLIVHSSRSSAYAGPRVIHIEFARGDLPGGLEWHART